MAKATEISRGQGRPVVLCDDEGGSCQILLRRMAEQYGILNTALETMAHGVAIFDAEQRLLICNGRYVKMYGFPEHLARPGTDFSKLVEYRLATDAYLKRPAEYEPGRFAAALSVSRSVHEFVDGRVIAICRRPMASGGWVTTHEDITEREELHRELRRQHEIVKEEQEKYHALNLKFDAAINNMTEGLCFFDGQERLIICNDRYAEMYGLSLDSIRPGMTFREIIELRCAAGSFPAMSPEEYYSWRSSIVTANVPCDTEIELSNGRILEIHHRPMPGGGWVATHDDITERRQAQARVIHMAHHDGLTNLPNRTLLIQKLAEAASRARGGEMVALHLFDLDHFKNVNDTLGHPIGDKLLRLVSRRLSELVRGTDLVARAGGDEFAIIQTCREREDASVLAQRVIEALTEPFQVEGHQVLIGTSIGVAVSPQDGRDEDELIRNADLALYRSKADGRSTYRFFEPFMVQQLQQRQSLECDLRKAIAQGEFELHYQPMIHLATREIAGLEALLRWRHPQQGFVMPDVFIPLAEEIGLIVPLGEWVIREACQAAARWPERMKVSVNLSPVQFRSPNLCRAVIAALAASGLSPKRLELEITETVLMTSSEATVATFNRLRGLGLKIAIDDFGSGYSSLSYLQKFPFDNLKIDRAFIKDITHSPSSRSIVRAIAAMASGLDMITTAEGVETEEQRAAVLAEGCTHMQGHLFSCPLPPPEVERLLSGHSRRSAFDLSGHESWAAALGKLASTG